MGETKEVTAPIMKALKQAGYRVFRMNSGKVKSRGGGWVHLQEEGTADILAFRPGHVFWIETKSADGKTQKQRLEAQQRFREDMVALGHTAIVAKSLDDVIPHLR